jgi:hypothetical protein
LSRPLLPGIAEHSRFADEAQDAVALCKGSIG